MCNCPQCDGQPGPSLVEALRDAYARCSEWPEKTEGGLMALLEMRNAGINAADEIEKLRLLLSQIDTTLCLHGKVDAGTDLHDRIQRAYGVE